MIAGISEEVKYLVYLLHCIFNDKAPKENADIDYNKLLNLAKLHQIYSIINPTVSNFNCVSDEVKAQLKNYSLSELTRMIFVNNERTGIFSELEEQGIKYMPLKGLILKSYYPLESMRQMSDNDILFEEKDRAKISSIMKARDYTIQETCGNSDDYYKPPYSTLEFHLSLFFDETDFCPVFDNLWQNATLSNGSSYCYDMDKTDSYIYSVCHMYKHYISGGCGIRFLADNYLFLRKEKDNLNWDYIDSFLDKYSISEYEKRTAELAFKIFDNKLDDLSESEIELFLDFINFGIYGTQEKKIEGDLNKYGDGSIKSKKFRYLFDRIFPPKKELITYHRILKDKPYLIPWFYIKRLFTAVFKLKKFYKEYKTLKNIK